LFIHYFALRLKKTPKPASAAVNIPQTTPSLDQTAGDDRVVWQVHSTSLSTSVMEKVLPLSGQWVNLTD
jgi:hypothetical protein